MARRHGRASSSRKRPRLKTAAKAPPARRARPKGLIWTGLLSFGLVNVPVSLHSGENRKDLGFSLLDKRDMAPIGYRKINKATGREVAQRDIVKGYEIAPDEFVTVTEDDFRRASPERTQRIDIVSFTDLAGIDPVYFDRPYYLEPAPKSEKAYALLREAMRKTGKAGIATIVLRARQHLCAVYARGPVLVVELLRYRSELRDPRDLHVPPEDPAPLKITEAELSMAERLVRELDAPWKPEAYKDEYREELLAFIEKKAKAGKTIEAAPVREEEEASASADIMDLLRRSLDKERR